MYEYCHARSAVAPSLAAATATANEAAFVTAAAIVTAVSVAALVAADDVAVDAAGLTARSVDEVIANAMTHSNTYTFCCHL